MGAALLAAGVVVWVVGLRVHSDLRAATSTTDDETHGDRLVSTGIGALALGAAVIVAFVARDLATTRGTPPGSERLIHLFVYNYERPWPTRFLDFRGPLFGFGVMTALSMAGLAVARARAYAAQGVVVASLLFAAWGLNIYMIDITPHWSQRGLFARYYAMRRPQTRDPRFTHDPIVAHQMNWKGENFYTGNRVVAEECGLKYCTGSTTEFVRDHAGSRVFFVTEHARLSGLLTIIRNAGGDGRAVTTEAENNKFLLVEATLGSSAPNTQGSSTRSGDARWTPTETR
jgi:hypothetical protein